MPEHDLESIQNLVLKRAQQRLELMDSEEINFTQDVNFNRYQKLASLVSSFTLNELVSGESDEIATDYSANDDIEELLNDCVQLKEAQTGSSTKLSFRWRMESTKRMQILGTFHNKSDMQDALSSIPKRRMDRNQIAFEQALRGERVEPANLDEMNALHNTLELFDALNKTQQGTSSEWQWCLSRQISKLDLDRQIGLETLVYPLRKLVGTHFRGRSEELKQLSEYVGILQYHNLLSVVNRMFRTVLSLQEEPPLMIYGPGGMGKSTLVAKFILDHVKSINEIGIPFAYVDLDRPALCSLEPVVLFTELVRQLRIQFPEHLSNFDYLESELRSLSGSSQSESQGLFHMPETAQLRFLQKLSEHLTKLANGKLPPLLLVIDTFERVQFHNKIHSDQIFSLLERMQKEIPTLRTIISGRYRAAFPTYELKLEKLDTDSVLGILESHQVPREKAIAIADQVNGNPLSLRLALSIFSVEGAGPSGLKDISTRFFFRFKESRIQSQLYSRLLLHIKNPEVRKLAHPGLVLRRITPDIIEKVLAEPCRIQLRDKSHPQEIFDELKKEVTLVFEDADGSLRHSSDIRATMVELLKEDDPQRVNDINRRAIQYYESQKKTPINRAEEIYHRLVVGQDHDLIESRWVKGVEKYLGADVIDELAPSEKGFLASYLDLDLPNESWRSADQDDWERATFRTASTLLRQKHPHEALKLIHARSERLKNSALFELEARIQDVVGKRADAIDTIDQGIRSARTSNNDLLLLRLLTKSFQYNLKVGNADVAIARYREAKELSRIRRKKLSLLSSQKGYLPKSTLLERYIACLRNELDLVDGNPDYRHLSANIFDALSHAEMKAGKPETAEKYASKAVSYYERAIKYRNEDLESWFGKGTGYLVLVEYFSGSEFTESRLTTIDSAVACFDSALALNQDDKESSFNRAYALSLAGESLKEVDEKAEAKKRFRMALESYEQVLALDPDDFETHSNMGLVAADLASLVSKSSAKQLFSRAIESFDQALRLEPYDYKSLFNKGFVHMTQAEVFTEENRLLAINSFEFAISCFNQLILEKQYILDSLVNKGLCSRSLAILERTRTKSPAVISHHLRASMESFELASTETTSPSDKLERSFNAAAACFLYSLWEATHRTTDGSRLSAIDPTVRGIHHLEVGLKVQSRETSELLSNNLAELLSFVANLRINLEKIDFDETLKLLRKSNAKALTILSDALLLVNEDVSPKLLQYLRAQIQKSQRS